MHLILIAKAMWASLVSQSSTTVLSAACTHNNHVTEKNKLTITYEVSTPCLKKTSHLRLAIILTYTIRLRQFLAEVLLRK